MYRGVFTIGVAVTLNSLTLSYALTNYSYIDALSGGGGGTIIARCVTGLGPTSTNPNANSALGGLYFNGIMILNRDQAASCGSDLIQARPGNAAAGVINIRQCSTFTTAAEGVYTCTMMNSSMMSQSVRFGIYFSGRSESFD